MSYKPDEGAWMAYLYGELEEIERQRIDEYILHNPEAGRELQRYKELRGLLSRMEDQEVIAPPIVVANNDQPLARPHFWKTHAFRTVAAVAASIILVILVGRFSGARVAVSDREFRLSFGDAPVTSPALQPSPGISQEEVRQMISESLEKNNALVHATIGQTQEELEKSLKNHFAQNSGKIDRLMREASSASQDQIRQYVDGIRTENMEQVKAYFQLTSSEQKQYIENLLVDFSKYLQQQRNNDLQLVQTRMNSLEQNTDMFKQETEQILSSIITTVGTPVQQENKY